MKTIRLLLVLLLAFTFVVPIASAKEVKIGYVNLGRLFDEYYKTKEYDKKLEAEHGDFVKEREAKAEKIRESMNKLGLLTDDQKTKLETEIEEMKTDLIEFDKQKQTDLTKKRNEKIREILLEIEKIVSDHADKEGYSVILNDRVLIYGNQSLDLTETILTILNSDKKK